MLVVPRNLIRVRNLRARSFELTKDGYEVIG